MAVTPLIALLFFARAALAAPPDQAPGKSAQSHFLQGVLLERRGSDADALKEYEKAFAADPRSAYICRQAADAAVESGDNEAAERWVGRLEKLEPGTAQTLILRGRMRWGKGDAAGAQSDFEAAIKLDPHSSESIFSLGNLLSASQPEKARALFLRLIQEDPDHAAEAHFQIALLDERAGKPDAAVGQLKEAIELEPSATPAIYHLGQLYETRRDTDSAIASYLQILSLEPQNAALIDHVGELYFAQNKFDEAKMRFEAARAISPADPAACQWLAMLAEKDGRFGVAADYVKASSALHEDPTLNLRLSYYLTQAGRLKEAVDVLEKAHARWPANDEVSYFLALGYDDLKETKKGVDVLRQVVSLKPDFRDARYQLAVMLEKSNRIAEAETEFRALLALQPNDASILNYLGYSLADRGIELDSARDLIERAARLDPENGAYQDSLGWVYYKLGRSTDAVRALEGAAQRIGDDAMVWDHLGDAYAGAGHAAAAWTSWKRAQALDPAGVKTGKKAAAAQGALSPEDIGAGYLALLGSLEGGFRKYSGVCELRAAILGRSVVYTALFSFHDDDHLDVDLLGPLFTPFLRARLGPEGFTMDPLHAPGLDPAAVSEAAFRSFSLLRDFLSGKIYAARPAAYKSSWRRALIEAGTWSYAVDPQLVRLDSVTLDGAPEIHLDLGAYGLVKGRQVPGEFTIHGKGFTLSVTMQKSSVEFK